MSQNYTPVEWVDETTSQQGTLINKARLDQMQTAHHYADGFEEVDTIPTADPGVSYHKVVYCTADSTFYRWNGTAWTKDIDDDTKALLDQEIARAEHAEGLIQGYLDAHEANHNNPHQVTKAQVGLGNCDNTADADKPISTAVQAALDTKADKATTLAGYGITDAYTKSATDTLLADKADKADVYDKTAADTLLAGKVDKLVSSPAGTYKSVTVNAQGQVTAGTNPDTLAGYGITDAYTKTEADTLLAAKADTTALTDGSVTKIGTADLGTDTKPIKLVAGVPTAVTNDLVSTSGAQTVGGYKTFTSPITINNNTGSLVKNDAIDIDSAPAATGNTFPWEVRDKDNTRVAAMQLVDNANGSRTLVLNLFDQAATRHTALQVFSNASSGDTWVQALTRAYNASNTTDVATIGTLDAYSPMVRTSGNQDILGDKKHISGVLGQFYVSNVPASGTYTFEVSFTGNTTQFAKVEIYDYINNNGTTSYEFLMTWNGSAAAAKVYARHLGPAASTTPKFTVDNGVLKLIYYGVGYHSVMINVTNARSWTNALAVGIARNDNPDYSGLTLTDVIE